MLTKLYLVRVAKSLPSDCLVRPHTHGQKKPPIPANLHPETGLFARKPGFLANFLPHVYGALARLRITYPKLSTLLNEPFECINVPSAE